MACRCAECLAHASYEELERIERAARELLTKADSDVDLALDAEDAEIMSTLFAAFDAQIGELQIADKFGRGITTEDYRRAYAAMLYQMDKGLALLSDSARSRLARVLDRVNVLLADMAGGDLNPISAGARMAEIFDYVEAQQGGAPGETIQYTPFEWSRLARTEATFAREAVRRTELERLGTDFSALDAHIVTRPGKEGDEIAVSDGASPPIHPQCLCLTSAVEVDGRLVAILWPAPTACELCNAAADEVMTAAGVPELPEEP